MIEILVLLAFSGLIFSSFPKHGLGNPFQIYFFVWFLVLFGYRLTQSSWITPSDEFLFVLLLINIFWFLFFIVSASYLRNVRVNPRFTEIDVNEKLIWIFQVLCISMLPLMYLKALELSGGESVFTVLGYIKLRSAVTEDMMGYGWLSYFTMLSMVASSVSIFLFKDRKITLSRLILSLGVSVAYLYLSTARTSFLLFFVLHLFPFVLTKQIGLIGIFTGGCLLLLSFIFVATMTAKGVSTENDLSDNVYSFLENTRGYTIAPLLAFSTLFEKPPQPMWGENTFRFFLSVFRATGFSKLEPPALIRDYAFVPDATNVYTVYEAYFRDFGGFGFAFVIFFATLHVYLYRRAVMQGGVYIFLYSASVYPLVMQFFQDQYFSLLSMWIQLFFWYGVVVKGIRFRFLRGVLRGA